MGHGIKLKFKTQRSSFDSTQDVLSEVERTKLKVKIQKWPESDIINLIKRNLRKAFKTEPKNESEVQDCVELILNVANVNHSKEKESFEYSSKSYIPDFVIKDLETVIEIKLCNSKDDESSIIGEINDDPIRIIATKVAMKYRMRP